jgi:carboxymethylenebutenolidase
MSGLCEHCVQGHTLQGTPSGTFQGSAYLHPAPTGSSTKRAVVVLTDIFGLNLVNNKLITDEYSKRLECDVWCPDIFEGARTSLRDRLVL